MFSNASVWGGLRWSRGDLHGDSDTAVLCLIGAEEIVVREARFGGVVAEPLRTVRPSIRPDAPGVADLR